MSDNREFPHVLLSAFVLIGAVIPRVTYAHHPLEGAIPETALQGILSGLGHPVIGVQHFFFIVAMALLASTRSRSRGYLIASGFVLTTLTGATAHVLGIDFHVIDTLIVLSLMLIGLILAVARGLQRQFLLPLVAISGLVHGHVYAETIIGATAAPLFSYLLGFSLMHLFLILGIAEGARFVWLKRPDLSERILVLAGCSTAIVGVGIGSVMILG